MNPFTTDPPSPWIIRYELEGYFGYNFALVLAGDKKGALDFLANSLALTEDIFQYIPAPIDIQPATAEVLIYILTARPSGIRLVSL